MKGQKKSAAESEPESVPITAVLRRLIAGFSWDEAITMRDYLVLRCAHEDTEAERTETRQFLKGEVRRNRRGRAALAQTERHVAAYAAKSNAVIADVVGLLDEVLRRGERA